MRKINKLKLETKPLEINEMKSERAKESLDQIYKAVVTCKYLSKIAVVEAKTGRRRTEVLRKLPLSTNKSSSLALVLHRGKEERWRRAAEIRLFSVDNSNTQL